jgi:hypothetical protein
VKRLREVLEPDGGCGVCPGCHNQGGGIAFIYGEPSAEEWESLIPRCPTCGLTTGDYGYVGVIQLCAQPPREEEATPLEEEPVRYAAASEESGCLDRREQPVPPPAPEPKRNTE